MNKDIIISTWGFGPTYRNRIKFQIEEALKSGYNPLMKYIILTDHVNDFAGLDQSMRDMIVDVVDIEDLRKSLNDIGLEEDEINTMIEKAKRDKEETEEHPEVGSETVKEMAEESPEEEKEIREKLITLIKYI